MSNFSLAERYCGGVTPPRASQAGFRVYAAKEASGRVGLRYVRASGTTAQRPTDAPAGHLYYDTDSSDTVLWTGSAWVATVPAGAVTSFNGRSTDAVDHALDDYTRAQVTNDTAFDGATLQEVLDNVDVLTSWSTAASGDVLLRPDGTGDLAWVRRAGTTAQRPGSPLAGQEYYDTDLSARIFYDGSDWLSELTLESA